MACIRVDSTFEKVVPMLERMIGPRRAWLHTGVFGEGWCVTQFDGYLKISFTDDRMKSVILLSL